MKTLLVILDGLGDHEVAELDHQTPLEKANTSNFDYMVDKGVGGLLKPSYEGDFPSSAEGHWNLFGYPFSEVMGRGVFEALGLNFKLKSNDVAFRGNWATLQQGKIIDRRAGRIKNALPALEEIRDIKIKGVDIKIRPGIEHRFALVLRGKNISGEVQGNDLHKTGVEPVPIKPIDFHDKKAVHTAEVLNEFIKKAHQKLKDNKFNKKRKKKDLLPANYLLLRGAGQWHQVEPFTKKWGFKKCGYVTGGGLYKGVASAVGMEEISVPGATGNRKTNLENKFKKAIKALRKDGFDFVFLHVKATDLYSHDGDCEGKKEYLEKIDRIAFDLRQLNDTIITITGDHCTPCELQEHTGDAIPFLVWSSKIKGDEVEKFCEEDCVQGEIIKQNQLIEFILNKSKNN